MRVKLPAGSGDIGWGWRWRGAVLAMAALAHPRRGILHGVIGRNGEERGTGSGALNIGDVVGGFADQGVGTLALNNHLQIGRIPLFIDNGYGLVVAHMAGGNGARVASAFGEYTADGLRAERFLGHIGVARATRPSFGSRIRPSSACV